MANKSESGSTGWLAEKTEQFANTLREALTLVSSAEQDVMSIDGETSELYKMLNIAITSLELAHSKAVHVRNHWKNYESPHGK